MSYTVRFESREGYLEAIVEGVNIPENIIAYLGDVHQACLKHRCHRVLIIENLLGPPLGTFDIYEVVQKASAGAIEARIKVAFVDTNPRHNEGMMAFAETVARNRSINMRQFADIEEARRWIAGDEL